MLNQEVIKKRTILKQQLDHLNLGFLFAIKFSKLAREFKPLGLAVIYKKVSYV